MGWWKYSMMPVRTVWPSILSCVARRLNLGASCSMPNLWLRASSVLVHGPPQMPWRGFSQSAKSQKGWVT